LNIATLPIAGTATLPGRGRLATRTMATKILGTLRVIRSASALTISRCARSASSGRGTGFIILQRWWYSDQEASATWRSQATDDLGFIAGEQLSDADKAILDEANRPHVVFNRVLTIIKAIAGMEINGRHEIVFLPEENSDTQVAEILTGASKWMGNKCDAEDEQSEAFQQCAVTGIGVTESRFTYEFGAKGKYLEEMFDCREFFWDRTAKKKNLVDARRMHRVRRMPLSDAMQMFPGKDRRQLDASWADAGFITIPGRGRSRRSGSATARIHISIGTIPTR
jgi:hypothetical protein